MRPRPLLAFGAGLGTAVVDCLGLLPGWWWITPAVAFLVTFLLRGFGVFALMLLGTLLGWTVMLFWHGGGSVDRIATMVGDIALDTGGTGWLMILATYLLALLLALTAGWFGSALRRLFFPTRPTQSPQTTAPTPH